MDRNDEFLDRVHASHLLLLVFLYKSLRVELSCGNPKVAHHLEVVKILLAPTLPLQSSSARMLSKEG